MTIWAIADLHLSLARDDPRDRFAGRWRDHARQIERNWREAVRHDDLVLLPGDLSMARNHRDLQPDFAWIDDLPGVKVLSPGNHDAWWNGAAKVRPMLRKTMAAVGGDAVRIGGVVVCGTLGCPASAPKQTQAREAAALDLALAEAAAIRQPGDPLYVLWHYPPFDERRQPGPAVERLEAAGATACVYGHLHIAGQWASAVQGEVRGVRYHCVAADAIGFRPIRVDRAAVVPRR